MASMRNHEELIAWQLAAELRDRVLPILRRPKVAKDFDFCDQLRRSARSGPANLAEGFGRHRPRDNARFVRIALATLHETQNHLGDGRNSGYIGEREFTELLQLSKRAVRTAVGWHNYLYNCRDTPLETHDDDSNNPRNQRTENPENPENSENRRTEN